MTHQIIFEPIGIRAVGREDESLLLTAQQAGIAIEPLCGGAGTCGKCRVRIVSGEVDGAKAAERHISAEEWADGYRLACQTYPRSDVRVYVCPESLSVQQRLQVEYEETAVEPKTDIQVTSLCIEAPTLKDLQCDALRVKNALGSGVQIPFALQQELADVLREVKWECRLVTGSGRLLTVLEAEAGIFGLAVDMGTTKVAAYLIDLEKGRVIDAAADANGQAAYGEDVISRIAFANESAERRETMRQALVDTLNGLIDTLLAANNLQARQLVEAVLVGNTAIHHLFLGLPVRQLGVAPYVAAVSEPMQLEAVECRLHMAAGAQVYLPGNIAGFVGADHASALLAADLAGTADTVILCDIGTNTEITLKHGGRLWSCSCASGPAFEGAHIRQGMRAAPGAIDHVMLKDGRMVYSTVGDVPARGICGSGILDAVAVLVECGALKAPGGLDKTHPWVELQDGMPSVRMGDADVWVSQEDVSIIQLAKGAIRAGIDILLEQAEISSDAVDRFILAGAFGTYIDPAAAMGCGMFPVWPHEKVVQIGNAAGRGAVQMLLNYTSRSMADIQRAEICYVELTACKKFNRILARAMMFEARN